MQDPVHAFLSRQGPELIQRLTTHLGLTDKQASRFLGALSGRMVDLLQARGVDVGALVGGRSDALLAWLDVTALAKTIGIDTKQAHAGARELLPTLVDHLRQDP